MNPTQNAIEQMTAVYSFEGAEAFYGKVWHEILKIRTAAEVETRKVYGGHVKGDPLRILYAEHSEKLDKVVVSIKGAFDALANEQPAPIQGSLSAKKVDILTAAANNFINKDAGAMVRKRLR